VKDAVHGVEGRWSMAVLIVNLADGDRQTVMFPDQSLSLGSSLYSNTGAFRLTFQASDGNVVLQVVDTPPSALGEVDGNDLNWTPVWSLYTQNRGAINVQMLPDGLKVTNSAGDLVGSIDVAFSSDVRLILQDDGNLVIYDLVSGASVARWASNTSIGEAPGANAWT
jgi:hypothetical protein